MTHDRDKELIIPAFSDGAYQLAQQRAHDRHNLGTFAFRVVARQYESIHDFIAKASATDPDLLRRAQCQGIVFDPKVGEKDFAQNTIPIFLEIASSVVPYCFLVRYSCAPRHSTLMARNMTELKKIKYAYWEKHATGKKTVQVMMYPDVANMHNILSDEAKRNSVVVLCGDATVPFESSFAGSVFNKYNNVIVVF